MRILAAVAAIAGVAINFATWGGGERGRLNLFSYFTIQSNILVALALLMTAARQLRGAAPAPLLGLFLDSARLWIWMTGLGFHFLLSALWHPTGLAGLANLLVHYVAPLAVLLEWLIFAPGGAYSLRGAWAWISYPLAYAAFSLARGSLDGFYPYWFLDPSRPPPDGVGSLPGALLWILALCAGLMVLGGVVAGLDSLRARGRGATREGARPCEFLSRRGDG